MITKTDQRRLKDGAQAMYLSESLSIQEMEDQLEQLESAACAMQSLDDLGSSEANKKAYDDMRELCRRCDEMQQKLLKAKVVAHLSS